MDPEQTFIRVQERFSQMLTPRIRASLEYIYLLLAITLFCILVVMHANYVQQPGCSSELSGVETTEAQLIQIRITSAGLWSQNDSECTLLNVPDKETDSNNLEFANVDGYGPKFWLNWFGSGAWRGKFALKFWKTDNEFLEPQQETSAGCESLKAVVDDTVLRINKDEPRSRFLTSAKESFKTAIIHLGRKWYGRLSFIWRLAKRILRGLWVSIFGEDFCNYRKPEMPCYL
ncbi:unnamed protein product [Ilex paraguariensis]|uniref:Uncharacterized protein n=1 Tax=Ilex paraguariensis TaxID=185542 RepID=A0ABC8SGM7_9AQUA